MNGLQQYYTMGPSTSTKPSIPIEQLQLPELLRNPHVMELYTRNASTTSTLHQAYREVRKISETKSILIEENLRLQRELDDNIIRLQNLETQLMPVNFPMSRPGSPTGSVSSLSPSDSISQRGNSPPPGDVHVAVPQRSSIRPAQYPVSVLWTTDDCTAEMNIGRYSSRIPMKKALRYSDGSMISPEDWDAVKTAARLVKEDLLALPLANGAQHWTGKRTQRYFCRYLPMVWSAAVAKMEAMVPLLQLCSSDRWKASRILSEILRREQATPIGMNIVQEEKVSLGKHTRSPSMDMMNEADAKRMCIDEPGMKTSGTIY